jgi:hypothetical protein
MLLCTEEVKSDFIRLSTLTSRGTKTKIQQDKLNQLRNMHQHRVGIFVLTVKYLYDISIDIYFTESYGITFVACQ